MVLSSLSETSGKSLLRELGFAYMLSLIVAYISLIIRQAISTREIVKMALEEVFAKVIDEYLNTL